jgi:class 3 adenylate cyclase
VNRQAARIPGEGVTRPGDTDLRALRVFLENVVCDLCRFRHAAEDGVPPGATRIHQEVRLGPGTYADIRVAAGDRPPYFVEVDHGYTPEWVLESVRRKYGRRTPASETASHVVVVVDPTLAPVAPALETELRGVLAPGLGLEIWDERHLLALIRKTFGLEPPDLTADRLLELGHAIDRAKAAQAFGPAAGLDPLQSMLLWHFAYWRLAELREAGRDDARAILPPGAYPGVVVLLADLCAYSSYVRDTRDDRVIRESLTTFASKTRYRIMNDGGMLYQFLGDAVIGFFGIPVRGPDDAARALASARALVEVGASVAEQWQRRIDRVQPATGVHVAMALGDVQMVSLRPFSHVHIGAVAEAINLAARLIDVAGPGEIVISNTLCQALPDAERAAFTELEPIEAKNIGRVRAWKLAAPPATASLNAR